MYYFVVCLLCAYGVFRCYLDSLHIKNVEDIEQHLREIADSLYSIKLRLRHEKDESMRK